MEQEIFNNLLTIFRENKLAHAYLFETKNVDKCYDDVILLIKKMVCSLEYSDNCNKCAKCHLIDERTMPSVVTIEPSGKMIKTESINNLKKAFSSMPTYTSHNFYIIKYPEKMNDTSYNKMLKFLEEPEDNIIGFFISSNKDSVASTILSRCELIKITDENGFSQGNLSDEEYEECTRISKEYFTMLEAHEKNISWYNTTTVLKQLPTQEQIVCFLNLIYNIYELKFHETKDFKIVKKLKIIEKYLSQLNYNVNISLLLDSFAVEMGEVDEL